MHVGMVHKQCGSSRDDTTVQVEFSEFGELSKQRHAWFHMLADSQRLLRQVLRHLLR